MIWVGRRVSIEVQRVRYLGKKPMTSFAIPEWCRTVLDTHKVAISDEELKEDTGANIHLLVWNWLG